MKIDDVVIAMPQQMRNQLMGVAPETLRRKFMLSNAPQQVIAFDLSEGKLYRAILSNRQLQEMSVFGVWHKNGGPSRFAARRAFCFDIQESNTGSDRFQSF